MKANPFKIDNSGFSLIQVLISASIVSMMIVSSMGLSVQTAKSQIQVKDRAAVDSLIFDATIIKNKKDQCRCNFVGLNLTEEGAQVDQIALYQNPTDCTGTIPITSAEGHAVGGVLSESISIQDVQDLTGGLVRAQLHFLINASENSLGAAQFVREVPIYFLTSENQNGTKKIESCVTESEAEETSQFDPTLSPLLGDPGKSGQFTFKCPNYYALTGLKVLREDSFGNHDQNMTIQNIFPTCTHIHNGKVYDSSKIGFGSDANVNTVGEEFFEYHCPSDQAINRVRFQHKTLSAMFHNNDFVSNISVGCVHLDPSERSIANQFFVELGRLEPQGVQTDEFVCPEGKVVTEIRGNYTTSANSDIKGLEVVCNPRSI